MGVKSRPQVGKGGFQTGFEPRWTSGSPFVGIGNVRFGKIEALVFGSIGASFIVWAATLFLSTTYPIGFIIGGLYLLVILVGSIMVVVRLKRQGSYEHTTPLEMFMYPFFPLLLAPLWLMCAAIAYEWKVDQPILRNCVLVGLFGASFGAFLFFIWIGQRKAK